MKTNAIQLYDLNKMNNEMYDGNDSFKVLIKHLSYSLFHFFASQVILVSLLHYLGSSLCNLREFLGQQGV